MGIVTPGGRHVTQVRHEILVTHLAMMLRIGQFQVHRPPGHHIPNIMQAPLVHMLSPGRLPARWTGTVALIAIFFDNLWPGQIFDLTKRSIGLVFARAKFGEWLDRRCCRFHPASLLQNPGTLHRCVGTSATVSVNQRFFMFW